MRQTKKTRRLNARRQLGGEDLEYLLAFERRLLRSDHPKTFQYRLQLSEYQTYRLLAPVVGTTEAELASLRASLDALYEELKDQVPQEI